MKRIFSGMLLVSLSLTGCGEKPKPAPLPVVAPPPVQANPSTSAPAEGVSKAAAPSGVSPAVAANSAMQRDLVSPNPEIYLKTLTDLLNAWVMSKNSPPKDLNEFVTSKMIAKLPVPPPGKKLAIDQKGMRVVLVDQ